jgi:transcriptional regulator with XRE-family HTH domain
MKYLELLELIKEMRYKNEYSQEYMASKLGVSQSTYSRMEQGKQALSWEQFLEILSLIGVDTDKLIALVNQQIKEELQRVSHWDIKTLARRN